MNDEDAPVLGQETQIQRSSPPAWLSGSQRRNVTFQLLLAVSSVIGITVFLLSLMTAVGVKNAAGPDEKQAVSSTTVPDYFQTSPQIFAGHTQTAQIAPFLAQTNAAPFGTVTFVPNAPLETSIPIVGNTNDSNVFEQMGHLSSYFANPVGFGVNEYPLPPGSNITHANILHRHGARYPTGSSSVASFGRKLYNFTINGTAKWSGPLSFLNTWRYTLGAEILVARGRQELFDSGVLFYYNYGHLYNTSSQIIARTTTQDRMLKSAEYFMAGFFGLEWTQNVTLELIIEQNGYNNSLAGYYRCNNSQSYLSTAGTNASHVWENIYLANATKRFNQYSGGYKWNIADVYNAQTLCPYETVAYGYSQWCDLFTYDEWLGFEYSVDLNFQGDSGFLSPTARGVGIGFVEELYARLQNHLYDLPPGATNVNQTLDTMNSTFPLNQNLYFDFSHDTNLYSILTAFGLEQFSDKLPNNTIPTNRNVTVSHITPFGARHVWEVIQAPAPVKSKRPTNTNGLRDFYDNGDATSYLHFMINQRTVPLGKSWPNCGQRDDGWCEMSEAMKVMDGLLETAHYEYSCFGNYTVAPYLTVTNGVPVTKKALGGGMGTGLEMRAASDRFVM